MVRVAGNERFAGEPQRVGGHLGALEVGGAQVAIDDMAHTAAARAMAAGEVAVGDDQGFAKLTARQVSGSDRSAFKCNSARSIQYGRKPAMTDLSVFAELVRLDHGLCVLSTSRGDGSVTASVVNTGSCNIHSQASPGRRIRRPRPPQAGQPARRSPSNDRRPGWLAMGGGRGNVDLFGPDDPHPDMSSEGLRLLLRNIFVAAGGTHDDWATCDRVMADEKSAAVLLAPRRTYPRPS